MTVLDHLVVRSLPLIPKPIVGRVAQRYIAGATLADAVRVVRALGAEGAMATCDVLGEDVNERAAAEAYARMYHDLLAAIVRERVDSNISVKLSALGLRFDRTLCHALLLDIARAAAAHGIFVRIDMEDASVTDATLEAYRAARAVVPSVGVVLQACLRRTQEDARALAAEGANIRLCKGIYREAESIAFQGRGEVQRNYLAILTLLLDAGSYVGIATHDDVLTRGAERLVQERSLARERYEFQMLLGVRDELRRSLLASGHRLRVYVPYGESWYAYSTRRLKENPQIAGYVFKAMMPWLFRLT